MSPPPDPRSQARLAVQREPSSAMAWTALADTEFDAGDAAAGLRAARRALQLAPGHPEPLARLGRGQWMQGKLAEAAASLGEAARRAPRHPGIAVWLAHVLEDTGDAEAASDCYARAHALLPGHPQIAAYLLAWRRRLCDWRGLDALGHQVRSAVRASQAAVEPFAFLSEDSTAAEQLVPTAEQLEREYGIPIVNKRISVTPIAEICAATDATDLTPIAVAMDRAGKEVGVDFVGGFSALVHKGASAADHKLMDSIPHALSVTDNVCSSVNVGSTRAGINMDAVLKMAGIVKATAEATADRQCIGAGKLVVFCNAVEDNPFMAGAFPGSGAAAAGGNVGVGGPGVVRAVLADLPKDADLTSVAEAI